MAEGGREWGTGRILSSDLKGGGWKNIPRSKLAVAGNLVNKASHHEHLLCCSWSEGNQLGGLIFYSFVRTSSVRLFFATEPKYFFTPHTDEGKHQTSKQ